MSGPQERSPKSELRLGSENAWFAAGSVAAALAGALYVMLVIAGHRRAGVLAGILFVSLFVVCGLVFPLILSCVDYVAQRAFGGRMDDFGSPEAAAPLRSPPVNRRRLAQLFPPRAQPVEPTRSAADDADERG